MCITIPKGLEQQKHTYTLQSLWTGWTFAPRWMLPALWTDPRGVVAHRVSRPGDVAEVTPEKSGWWFEPL